jgi:Cu/Ag efflux pump CusA
MPLIFASGPGAGARNSIGIMLTTGMIIGTAFTLFVVPRQPQEEVPRAKPRVFGFPWHR